MAYIEVTKVQYLDVKEIRRASLLFLEQINTSQNSNFTQSLQSFRNANFNSSWNHFLNLNLLKSC